jgi:hypothetical protein
MLHLRRVEFWQVQVGRQSRALKVETV